VKKIFLILLATIVMLQAWTIQDDPYYKHKKSQFQMLSQNTKYTTVMLGDSITDEGQWDELLDNPLVQNRGISGDTTQGVLQRLDSTNKSIKQVFIMIGVNDIMRGKEAAEVYLNYLKIIKFFQDRNIKVYIQSTLFIGEKRAENFNPKIEELNKKLEAFAKENSITFINLNQIFAGNKMLEKEFTFDDLHLNGAAYKLWAQDIKKYF
jgi:lysophospholipase L1-like esterase